MAATKNTDSDNNPPAASHDDEDPKAKAARERDEEIARLEKLEDDADRTKHKKGDARIIFTKTDKVKLTQLRLSRASEKYGQVSSETLGYAQELCELTVGKAPSFVTTMRNLLDQADGLLLLITGSRFDELKKDGELRAEKAGELIDRLSNGASGLTGLMADMANGATSLFGNIIGGVDKLVSDKKTPLTSLAEGLNKAFSDANEKTKAQQAVIDATKGVLQSVSNATGLTSEEKAHQKEKPGASKDHQKRKSTPTTAGAANDSAGTSGEATGANVTKKKAAAAAR